MESIDIVHHAREAFLSKKGGDLLTVDVRGLSTVADYFMVVSGATAPQLKALSNAAVKELKEQGVTCHRRSGVPDDGWVVLDYGDVVMHIFLRDLRDYYAIEELWADAPRVE
jgi:ribosome-associated protein